MSKKASGPASPKTNQGAGKGAQQVQYGYVPFERGGYTPVTTTSKLPRLPRGGTGVTILKLPGQNAQGKSA